MYTAGARPLTQSTRIRNDGRQPAESVRRCSLQSAVGHVQPCPGSHCPFWDEGGAVLEGGCMLERMLPPEDWTPELAARWLALRRSIDRARDAGRLDEVRALFQRVDDGVRPRLRTASTGRSSGGGTVRSGT